MKQLRGRWKAWITLNWPESLICQWRFGHLSDLEHFHHHCLLTVCPLSCPVSRFLVPAISFMICAGRGQWNSFDSAIWSSNSPGRDCRAKDRRAERILSVKAHCTGGIQFNSVRSQLLYWSRNAKPTTKCSFKSVGVLNWATAVWRNTHRTHMCRSSAHSF